MQSRDFASELPPVNQNRSSCDVASGRATVAAGKKAPAVRQSSARGPRRRGAGGAPGLPQALTQMAFAVGHPDYRRGPRRVGREPKSGQLERQSRPPPAWRDMLDSAATAEPSEQTTNRIMAGRTILNGWPVRSPVNASLMPSRATAHDSGSMRFATPHRDGLAPSTPCRSPGALRSTPDLLTVVGVRRRVSCHERTHAA
jgi:hypothetical protein